MTKPVRKKSDVDTFLADLGNGDILTTVLKGHLHVMSLLIENIELKMDRPGTIQLERFNIGVLARLAAALGQIPNEAISGFEQLNILRNHFAHKLGYELSDKDVEDLWSSLSSEERDLVADTYNKASSRELKVRSCIYALHLEANTHLGLAQDEISSILYEPEPQE